jgi:hypothetical protein
VETNKQKFLDAVKVRDESDALKNTIKASFQRNKLYAGKPNLADRKELHDTLKRELQRISAQNNVPVSEERHCQNIEQLADSITKQFACILRDGRFKIGTAQKALNLHLKFRWCLEKQNLPPPHCPLDSRILKKAGVYMPWTTLDSIETYKDWIEKVKAVARPKSLPEWELDNWKR